MRIATKLVAGSSAGMLLVLGVHAITMFRRETSLLRANGQQEGERIAHAMAVAVGREWDRNGKSEALSLLARIDSGDRNIKLRWLGPALAPSRPDNARRVAGTRAGAFSTHEESTDELHSYSAIPGDAGALDRGVVEAVQDLTGERARMHSSLLQLARAVLLVLVLNALLATILSRRWVTQPVAKLLSMSRDVGNGGFSGRVSLASSSGRELVQLADALNNMAGRLEGMETARDREEQRRIQSEAQLRHAQRLTTVGRLASGVAHEIGTPLNVIAGHANMIRRHQVDADGAVQSAEIIATHADRVTSMVRQLLGFARRKGPERCKTDLVDLAAKTVTLLRSFAGKQRVSLVSPLRDQPQLAHVDPNQMEQVLTNLVTNGIQAILGGGTVCVDVMRVDATPPASVDGTSATSATSATSGEYICMRVVDDGEGMSDDQRVHIFDPFFTTKDVGEGTGLGLSIAHGIIRDHGGWIQVDSTPGKGSTFSVFVPGDDA